MKFWVSFWRHGKEYEVGTYADTEEQAEQSVIDWLYDEGDDYAGAYSYVVRPAGKKWEVKYTREGKDGYIRCVGRDAADALKVAQRRVGEKLYKFRASDYEWTVKAV